MLFLKLHLPLIVQLIFYSDLLSFSFIQVIHCENVFHVGIGRDGSLHDWNVLHSEHPGLSVHDTCSKKANYPYIEKEENEWFKGQVADTIIRPWTMMIHLVHASIALATVVHTYNLECTTLITLHRVFGLLLWFGFGIFFLYFVSVKYSIDPLLTVFLIVNFVFLCPKMVPFYNTGIIASLRIRMTPESHSC